MPRGHFSPPAETGARYARWTIIGGTRHRPHCRCDCGSERVLQGSDLYAGKSKSCGCLSRERTAERGRMNRRHGFADTPTMTSWTEMKRRCYAKHRKEYVNYGGRDIVVCDRWLESFANFLEDMGERPANTTLERINNDGPYSPGNCRWASRKQQERNKRSNAVYEFKGEQLTVAGAAEQYGLRAGLIYTRLRNGWAPDEALGPLRRPFGA